MARISLRLICECDRIPLSGLPGLGCKAIPWKHPWLPRFPGPPILVGLITVTDQMLAPPVICSAVCEVATQPLTVSLSDSRTRT